MDGNEHKGVGVGVEGNEPQGVGMEGNEPQGVAMECHIALRQGGKT